MSDAAAALRDIQTFVELAKTRRVRALDAEAKARMEALDEALREVIEGARPAPKRIANPTAVASAPSGGNAVAPAKINVKASQVLEQALELSPTDKKKLGEVTLESLPQSSYTPPRIPAFMADYYTDDLVPASVAGTETLTSVVNAGGDSMDLAVEVKILLGLERPAPRPEVVRARPARSSVETQAARPSTPSQPKAPVAPRGIPVIVHMLAGGTQRGRVEGFEPKSGHLELLGKDPNAAARVPLRTVLAVFFGARPGGGTTEATGTGLAVQLVNDKTLSGLSPDYDEGGDALTLVPEPRRGNIDHIWIPAWAVKAIELT